MNINIIKIIFLVLFVANFSFSFAYSHLTPQQQQQKDQMIDMAMKGLQNPYAGFELIAQQVLENFHSNTAPGIAEKFAGLGAIKSSAFSAAMLGSEEQLKKKLAAMKIQYGIQSQIQYQQLLALALSIQ